MRFPSGHHFLAALLAVASVIVVGTVTAWEAPPETSPDPLIVRIYYDEIGDLKQLSSYDLFEVNNLQERFVLAAVSSEELKLLQNKGWIVIPEISDWRELGRDRYFNGYRTVDELYAEMGQLAAQYPSLTEMVTYGQSYCKDQGGCVTPGGDQTAGYDLLAMRVTNERVQGTSIVDGRVIERGNKPLFFVLANIHARELTTPEIAMRWMELLLEQYGSDPDITWLVDWHELWIIPTANPDGHWITELGSGPPYSGYPLMHRKNFDQDADGDGTSDCDIWPSSSYSQFGVDLNRNHSFAWLDSDGACSLTYSGPSAASEPEVAALQNLLRALFADRRGPDLDDMAAADTSGMFFTLHNYSQLVLRPWGFSSETPPNEDALKAIGDKLATFNGYLSCRPPDCLYYAHGTTDDWAYGELGMPAFTFEIGSTEQGFSPPYAVIDAQQWPNNRDAFLYAARIARRPYQLISGPDVSNIAFSATSNYGDLKLTVVVDDRGHGGQTIAAAQYSIDLPFWDDRAETLPMNPTASNLQKSVQEFYTELDNKDASPGRHLIFLRGLDSSGNVGPTRAAYFDILEPGITVPTLTFVPFAVSQ